MRKLSKTLLSLLLIAAMLASFVVLPAAAEEPAAEQPTEAVQAAETQATDDTSYRYNIVHVDAAESISARQASRRSSTMQLRPVSIRLSCICLTIRASALPWMI